MQQLICVNKRDFERICRDEGWSDSNPPTDAALVSICCNEEVAKFVLSDGDAHFFSEDHANVLNVEFDDITEDVKVFDGEEARRDRARAGRLDPGKGIPAGNQGGEVHLRRDVQLPTG